MRYTDFNYKEHGFVGHMAEPDQYTDKAVIIIMGGEKSILHGIKIAERFADFGITGISVSLFGAEGLPKEVDRIPLDMFEPVIAYLKNVKRIHHISTYGISMGSIFAMLVAQYIGGIDNVVICSPSHVVFEATKKDKKHMLDCSIATWRGEELPYVKQDFSSGGMGKYEVDVEADHQVMRMWNRYNKAYKDKKLEQLACVHPEKTEARILMIAGTGDEAWPSLYSINFMQKQLEQCKYGKDYKVVIYPDASHLIGIMPNKDRNRMLYKAMPLIGLMYKSIGMNREKCVKAMEQSEKEVIDWLSII